MIYHILALCRTIAKKNYRLIFKIPGERILVNYSCIYLGNLRTFTIEKSSVNLHSSGINHRAKQSIEWQIGV